MTSIQSQLDQVLALAEKATPGPWRVSGISDSNGGDYVVSAGKFAVASVHNGVDWTPAAVGIPASRQQTNAQLLAAAVNFLREHGPAIRAAVGGEADCQWFEVIDSEAGDFRNGQSAWSSIGTCLPVGTRLYLRASPPATVDVGSLRGLVDKLRTRGPASPMTFNIGTVTVNKTPYEVGLAERKLIADELAALIGKEA